MTDAVDLYDRQNELLAATHDCEHLYWIRVPSVATDKYALYCSCGHFLFYWSNRSGAEHEFRRHVKDVSDQRRLGYLP